MVEPANETRHIGHLRPLWELTETDLRPYRVKEVLLNLLGEPANLAPPTVNKVRGTGRRIIREAQINDEWHGPNPFEVVRRLKEIKPTHRILTLEECRAVLPHLRADRRREALMMLYLGLRPGEWKALRREDVDLVAGVMTVRRSNGRNSTKTGKIRVIPIPSALRPHLEEAIAESPEFSNLIFPGREGKRQRHDVKLSKILRHALRKAGLVSSYKHSCRRKDCGYKEHRAKAYAARCPRCNFKLWANGVPLQIRFYDLRHSAATLHRRAGADPLAIQLVLGHTPENVTDSVYTHLSMDDLRREIEKLQI